MFFGEEVFKLLEGLVVVWKGIFGESFRRKVLLFVLVRLVEFVIRGTIRVKDLSFGDMLGEMFFMFKGLGIVVFLKRDKR